MIFLLYKGRVIIRPLHLPSLSLYHVDPNPTSTVNTLNTRKLPDLNQGQAGA